MTKNREGKMPLELRKLNLNWVKNFLECKQDAKRPSREVSLLVRPKPKKLNLNILPGMFDFGEDEEGLERKFNEGN